MKKHLLFAILLVLLATHTQAQDLYWVFFTDKANTTFDPCSYFDAKAIERRAQLGLPLSDSTDFPLNEQYVQRVAELSEEVIGESRWFNALAVSTFHAEEIQQLPFVAGVRAIESHARLASETTELKVPTATTVPAGISHQLKMMQGECFVEKGFDGSGIRIAILDGGFKMADTHPSFRHLRENNRILKTYNFPLKKENVYGWDSHGTMVLSCIAGFGETGEQLGLATGAEFLLARTETYLEPKQEEVWWMMGMEWADRNGANIINSSLGYGKDRYNPADMDGTSLVARAANMAAAKGMLVCCSMGNEGDDKSWLTLVTPADADSVLSVGGVNNRHHSSTFTSFGPTADGRLKPNVSAMATDVQVANPSKSYLYTQASGTSFSSPLTAGFAACAWQTHREWTNMQLLKEIEKSADLYPYYDYQFGFGVPQASYFIDNQEVKRESPFTIYEGTTEIYIIANDSSWEKSRTVYFHETDSNNNLTYYGTALIDAHRYFSISKKDIEKGRFLRVHCDGYTTEYHLGDNFSTEIDEKISAGPYYMGTSTSTECPTPVFKGVLRSNYNIVPYISWGFAVPSDKKGELQINYGKSESFLAGVRFKGNICKWYNLGCALEIGAAWYNLAEPRYDDAAGDAHSRDNLKKENIRTSFLNAEIFQRFRLAPGGLTGYGIYFDMGFYAGWNFYNRHKTVSGGREYRIRTTTKALDMSKYQIGVRARFGFGPASLYVQYRLNRIDRAGKSAFTPGIVDMPKLEVGLQLVFPVD
ncbi:MAG: S8 family serine peptidase [Bacteroidales bacterium]|nr:S8 family serine peptidase [Bacteroidales bacterium]